MNETTDVIKANSRSFSLAAAFLPRRFRRDVTSLYAWCRTVDDAVDHANDPSEAKETLTLMKQDVERVAGGQAPVQPATSWIADLIRTEKIDAQHAIELIEGMEMDADGFRVRTDGDLRRYCYHAAGTVGLMMSQLMGVRSSKAKQPAIALGVAMQITNIARDVREDAMRGRCYLPRVSEPLTVDPAEVVREVQRVLSLAEQQYDLAISGIHHLPRGCRRAIRVALAVYREIGREILRQGCPVLDRRVVLSRSRLAVVAVRAAILPSNTLRSSSLVPAMISPKPTQAQRSPAKVAQARSSVCLGLSLTAIMAAVLFVLVYVNPKDASYGSLPLIYAAGSLIIAIVMNRLSVRFETVANESQ